MELRGEKIFGIYCCVCVCRGWYMHAYVQMCLSLWPHVVQKSMLSVFLNHSSPYFVIKGLSLNWEISGLGRLASLQTPKICLFLTVSSRNRNIHFHIWVSVDTGDGNSGPPARPANILPSPQSYISHILLKIFFLLLTSKVLFQIKSCCSIHIVNFGLRMSSSLRLSSDEIMILNFHIQEVNGLNKINIDTVGVTV